LLDDHEVVRRGVRELLEGDSGGEIEVSGEASTAEEALRRLSAVGADVAVLDVRLPEATGWRSAGRSARGIRMSGASCCPRSRTTRRYST
jgi:DNA-binding NarL/FixJ family response regulator